MILGIDIGTSTLSFVISAEDGQQAACLTLPNDSSIPGQPWNRLQDPERIVRSVEEAYAQLRAEYPIRAVGITCQMHGILYVDDRGRAASPLYTWEDETGQQPCPEGGTWLERLNTLVDSRLVKGIAYGSLTHFALTRAGKLPPTAVQFCAIGDYVAMRLTGRTRPCVHVSLAASFGLYDLAGRRFDDAAIRRAGMDPAFFPEILIGETCLGRDEYGALVSVAIGDNQASFLGSVADFDSQILLNLGTGGQISCYTGEIAADPRIDTRPLLEDGFLAVYTSHCAGRAYAALERFFREVLELAGVKADSLYEQMNAAAAQGRMDSAIRVEPAFCGSRQDPDATCSMDGITLDNFTPRDMILGFMTGVCMELFPFFKEMSKSRRFLSVTGSGNLIRRNPAMQGVVERAFGLPLRLSDATEEAAMGAIRFAGSMSGGHEK